MMTFSEMKEKWKIIPVYSNVFLLIDSEHPVEINIGYEVLNQKTLLIQNTGKLKNIASSKSIIASNYQFPDGSWVLSFRLVRSDDEEVFLRFCWDLIESSRDQLENTTEFILRRYNKWLRLMEHIRTDIMDVARQKGLFGELLYLSDLVSRIGADKAVASWCGPEDADQDFVFDDTWTEVKATGIAAESVTISSLEQLQVEKFGTLFVCFIEKTTPENEKGISLAQMVNNARSIVTESLIAKEMLELKLFQYGYKDLQEYNIQKYRLCGKQEYFVNDQFPRLNNNNVNSAIIRAKYAISLSAIESFKK